jgi:hypothetical protein
MATFGLDISHHQGAFDIGRAAGEGCEFFILKATEGSGFTDSRFAENLRKTRAAGKLVAAYHYQRSNVSAASQVAHIQRVVSKDIPVIPDVEANSGGVGLTRDIVNRLRSAGYKVPLLYLPRWYWQQIGSPSLEGLPPLWSSRYPDMRQGSLSDEYADVPSHYWDGYGGLPVAVLQFTSSARVAGRSPIDGNAFRGSAADLRGLFGRIGGGGAAPGQEDDMPLSDKDIERIWDHMIYNHQLKRKEWAKTSLGAAQDRIVRQQIAPLRGEVAALAEAHRQDRAGEDRDLDAVRQAAEEGTRKALAEGTVNVDIDVTGPEGSTA